MVLETTEPALGNTAGEGVKYGACGMFGGSDGLPHFYWLQSDGRADRPLKTKETGVELLPGDVIHVHSGGGGGWGDPAKRSAAAHALDIAEGFVSGDKA
jgi:N-methylhydantoinase B